MPGPGTEIGKFRQQQASVFQRLSADDFLSVQGKRYRRHRAARRRLVSPHIRNRRRKLGKTRAVTIQCRGLSDGRLRAKLVFRDAICAEKVEPYALPDPGSCCVPSGTVTVTLKDGENVIDSKSVDAADFFPFGAEIFLHCGILVAVMLVIIAVCDPSFVSAEPSGIPTIPTFTM